MGLRRTGPAGVDPQAHAGDAPPHRSMRCRAPAKRCRHVAPRNFQQPFNRPQFHANEQNAPRSLMAVTETRRWRHSWPTFPDEVRCDSAERFAGLKSQRTSTTHLRGGSERINRSIACSTGTGVAGPARPQQRSRSHWPTRSPDASGRWRIVTPLSTAITAASYLRPSPTWRVRVTGIADQAISASCTRSPYRKG